MRTAPEGRDSRLRAELRCAQRAGSDLEAPGGAVFHDVARTRRREMRTEDQHRAIAVTLQECAARAQGLLGLGVRTAAPFGMRALDRVMHQIAGDDRVLAA